MRPLRCSAAVLLVAVLSCSGEPTAPLGPPNVVEGAWIFSAELINSDRNLVCEHYGTINVTQSGSTLSGTVRQTLECVGPSDTVFNTGTVAFTAPRDRRPFDCASWAVTTKAISFTRRSTAPRATSPAM